MKQLLLNFLFFVGAAFIFIQCAQLFPSNKTRQQQNVKPQQVVIQKSASKPQTGLRFASYNFAKVHFRRGAIISYLDNGIFPLNMITYLKRNPFLLNRNFGFYYTDIFGRPIYRDFSFNYANPMAADVDLNAAGNDNTEK